MRAKKQSQRQTIDAAVIQHAAAKQDPLGDIIRKDLADVRAVLNPSPPPRERFRFVRGARVRVDA